MEAASRPHFGALLRSFRLDAGMTQQELAERARLSVEAISSLERGARTRPRRETIALLGPALSLSPEREALLVSAGDVAHPPRQRNHSEARRASLLSIVRAEAQTIPKHNLPQRLTSFVGRRQELQEIASLLREHRLVTIVGAGGVGKTRVAVKLASDVLDGYPDGVWLVDLAALADQTLVARAVMTTLQLASITGSALDCVVAYLKARRVLLILDNCEHVIASAREVALGIEQLCPYVRILSTSREALGVANEQFYRLPSLAVPSDSPGSAQDALLYDAVKLFADRALTVDAGFVLSDDNAQDVAKICRHLDGIALAIELAAARVNVLVPRQIAERLDKRFRLLTSGNPRALPRQHTMRALIDWSYDLLSPREQRFFESLSVFAGSCTLDEATAVCAVDDEDDIDVVELLASLVTKSLLVAELSGNEQRFRLLESSRHYAREKLIVRGDQEQLARRHALVYLDLAEKLERALVAKPDREWLPQAQVESENWRAVLEWAFARRGDVILGQRLIASRRVVWSSLGLDEGRRWLRAALESVDERTPPDLNASLALTDADAATLFGERKIALAAAERAFERYRDLGDTSGIAHAKFLMGAALMLLGRPADGEPLLQEALQAARTLGDRRLAANVLGNIGSARSAVGDFDGARAHLTEALGVAKAVGADVVAASIVLNLAINEDEAGDPAMALRLTADVIASPPTKKHAATALSNTAGYLVTLGRCREARARANEALELARALRIPVLVVLSLQHLAEAALLEPQTEGQSFPRIPEVAHLCGFVDARRTTLGISVASQQEFGSALAVLRDAVGAVELASLMGAGARLSEDEAIALAVAFE